MMFHSIHIYLFLLCYPTYILGETCLQNFYWRDYIPGTIPYDALVVGNSRYVGQVNHNRGHIPGTILPHGTNSITFENNGRQILKTNIHILCSPELKRFYWEKVDFSKPYNEQMKNAVAGGYQLEYDHLYIGAIYDNGELKIGKVVPMEYEAKKGLYYWLSNGQAKIVLQFDLLKYNPTDNPINGTLSATIKR